MKNKFDSKCSARASQSYFIFKPILFILILFSLIRSPSVLADPSTTSDAKAANRSFSWIDPSPAAKGSVQDLTIVFPDPSTVLKNWQPRQPFGIKMKKLSDSVSSTIVKYSEKRTRDEVFTDALWVFWDAMHQLSQLPGDQFDQKLRDLLQTRIRYISELKPEFHEQLKKEIKDHARLFAKESIISLFVRYLLIEDQGETDLQLEEFSPSYGKEWVLQNIPKGERRGHLLELLDRALLILHDPTVTDIEVAMEFRSTPELEPELEQEVVVEIEPTAANNSLFCRGKGLARSCLGSVRALFKKIDFTQEREHNNKARKFDVVFRTGAAVAGLFFAAYRVGLKGGYINAAFIGSVTYTTTLTAFFVYYSAALPRWVQQFDFKNLGRPFSFTDKTLRKTAQLLDEYLLRQVAYKSADLYLFFKWHLKEKKPAQLAQQTQKKLWEEAWYEKTRERLHAWGYYPRFLRSLTYTAGTHAADWLNKQRAAKMIGFDLFIHITTVSFAQMLANAAFQDQPDKQELTNQTVSYLLSFILGSQIIAWLEPALTSEWKRRMENMRAQGRLTERQYEYLLRGDGLMNLTRNEGLRYIQIFPTIGGPVAVVASLVMGSYKIGMTVWEKLTSPEKHLNPEIIIREGNVEGNLGNWVIDKDKELLNILSQKHTYFPEVVESIEQTDAWHQRRETLTTAFKELLVEARQEMNRPLYPIDPETTSSQETFSSYPLSHPENQDPCKKYFDRG